MSRGKCPECGARIQFDADAREVTCEYCHACFPGPAAQRPPRRPPPPSDPTPTVAHHPHANYRKTVFVIIAVMVIGVMAPMLLTVTGLGSKLGLSCAGQGLLEHMQVIGSRAAVPTDVNGDGVVDAVAWIRFITAGSDMPERLAAFDGNSGKRLWLSEPLGKNKDLSNQRDCFTTKWAMVAGGAGLLQGVDLMTGQVGWSRKLDERVKTLCALGKDKGWLELKDGRELVLDPATGEDLPPPAGQARWPGAGGCRDGWSTLPYHLAHSPGVELEKNMRWKIPPGQRGQGNVSVDSMLTPTSGELKYGLGVRQPGSKVPMVTAINKASGQPRWTMVLPAADPMAAEEKPPKTAALAPGGRLLVPYKLTAGAWRLVCLDAATGKRLWEAAITSPRGVVISKLSASDRSVFVVGWTYLHILDLETGKHRVTVGRW